MLLMNTGTITRTSKETLSPWAREQHYKNIVDAAPSGELKLIWVEAEENVEDEAHIPYALKFRKKWKHHEMYLSLPYHKCPSGLEFPVGVYITLPNKVLHISGSVVIVEKWQVPLNLQDNKNKRLYAFLKVTSINSIQP